MPIQTTPQETYFTAPLKIYDLIEVTASNDEYMDKSSARVSQLFDIT